MEKQGSGFELGNFTMGYYSGFITVVACGAAAWVYLGAGFYPALTTFVSFFSGSVLILTTLPFMVMPIWRGGRWKRFFVNVILLSATAAAWWYCYYIGALPVK